jgi:RNA-directed DNA polymerase
MNKIPILWNKVNWNLSESRISRIQKRIYSASKHGDIGRVRFLQDLLIRSLDAKLIAVRRVTSDSSGRKTAGVDRIVYTTPESKARLVSRLRIDGRAAPIRRVWIPGKPAKRPLGIPILRDRAKQKLVLMALEPEWEAKFEPGSYGCRPGRSCHDAIEALFRHLRNKTGSQCQRKFILDADLKGCFENIDHDYLLGKLGASPIITKQIRSWLKAGIFDGFSLLPNAYSEIPENLLGTPPGGVISPFLANVALHGMEEFLKDWICTQTWPVEKQHQLYKVNKIKSIGVVRYADDFIVTHVDKNIIERALAALEVWFSNTSKLQFNVSKTNICDSTQGVRFLGFSIINIVRNGVGRVKIYPSIINQKSLIAKLGVRCRKFRSISAFDLIKSLRPIVIGWANYFRYCECKETFSSLDKKIFNVLRSWVFRRDRRHGRVKVKEKYFPSGKTFLFEGRKYNNNWILCGKIRLPGGVIADNFLPRISWKTSKKYISVKGDASVYDGNIAYWGQRTMNYGNFNTGQRTLMKKQNGICPLCGGKFLDDYVQIDHIIPRSIGGNNTSKNLQLVHTHCHIIKTGLDRHSDEDQEPDEVKISRPDL